MRAGKLTSFLLARKGTAQAVSEDGEMANLYPFPSDTSGLRQTASHLRAAEMAAPRSATEATGCFQRGGNVAGSCQLAPRLYLQLDLVAFSQNRSIQETVIAALESYAACNLPAQAHPLCEQLVKTRNDARERAEKVTHGPTTIADPEKE